MMTWRNRAACLDEDPELFFPIGNTGPALFQIEEAKAVCGRCKVVGACLNWAIEYGQDAGVWAVSRRMNDVPSSGVMPASAEPAEVQAPLCQGP